jgi:hypothetical protein
MVSYPGSHVHKKAGEAYVLGEQLKSRWELHTLWPAGSGPAFSAFA